jgi:hypothetical protein
VNHQTGFGPEIDQFNQGARRPYRAARPPRLLRPPWPSVLDDTAVAMPRLGPLSQQPLIDVAAVLAPAAAHQQPGEGEQQEGGPCARCDVSEAHLTCGRGWYHKVGTNYDLCQAEYQRLRPKEQVMKIMATWCQPLWLAPRVYPIITCVGV